MQRAEGRAEQAEETHVQGLEAGRAWFVRGPAERPVWPERGERVVWYVV